MNNSKCQLLRFSFTHSVLLYLLVKSLSPVKDLEQPVSTSFSSSTQIGGDEVKNVGRVEEDGREELEEEDAELNSPSPPCTISDPSLSPSVSSGEPPRPAPCPGLASAPGSESMIDNLFRFCGLILNHVTFWQDKLQLM